MRSVSLEAKPGGSYPSSDETTSEVLQLEVARPSSESHIIAVGLSRRSPPPSYAISSHRVQYPIVLDIH